MNCQQLMAQSVPRKGPRFGLHLHTFGSSLHGQTTMRCTQPGLPTREARQQIVASARPRTRGGTRTAAMVGFCATAKLEVKYTETHTTGKTW